MLSFEPIDGEPLRPDATVRFVQNLVQYVLDWLIPAELRRDPEAYRNSKRVLAFAASMLFWVPIFVAIYAIILDCPVCAAILWAAGWMALISVLLQRWLHSPRIAGHFLTFCAAGTYTALAWFTGGHASPPSMWFVSVPIIATVLVGARAGAGWSLVSATAITVLYWLPQAGYKLPELLTESEQRFLEVSGLTGIMLCVLVLTIVFKSIETATQHALSAAVERAEAAHRAKSLFLANMSHELRTPLTAVLGFAENLLDPEFTRVDREEAIRAIQRNGAHLLRIINEILDLSKIEAQKFRIEMRECDLRELLEDLGDIMRPQAAEKRIDLVFELHEPVPKTIRTDPTRLRQILINLIENAVKFTENGRILVEARYPPDAPSPRLEIAVTDSGIGIPAEQIRRLFQPFWQADSSMSRRFGGAGLGLAISKRLAELLGGGISVTSKPGYGSTFRLTIPTERLHVECADTSAPTSFVPGENQSSHDGLPLQGLRVLLAEDGVDNQRLIAFLLCKAGAEVIIVENGWFAVQSCQSAEQERRPFDVVLMDMQMPVCDGYRATRELRNAGCRTPVIALTAHAMRGDREKCLAAGCDDYATKPLDRQELIDLVARYGRHGISAG